MQPKYSEETFFVVSAPFAVQKLHVFCFLHSFSNE